MKSAFLLAASILLTTASVACAQNDADVSLCDLAKNPKTFDGKAVRVRGTLQVSFEDFTISTKECDTEQGVWVAFGGDVPGVVASTINDNLRKTGVNLTVDGVSYGIKKDENLHKLYALIASRHGDEPVYRVTATLTGVFLAGTERKLGDGRTDFGGYGHLGCCSLLVITQVTEVASAPPAALDLDGVVEAPDGQPQSGFTVFDDVLGGWPPLRQETTTDNKGRFHFSNSGQLLRLEDPRYRPVALAIEPGGAPVRVRLEDAKKSDWLIRDCGSAAGDSHEVGFTVRFKLPKTLTSSRFDDEDMHTYFVHRKGEESFDAELFISSGPETAWRPSDEIIASNWSRQRWIRDDTGRLVGIDAVGRGTKGGRWRTTVFFDRESASYSLKKERSTRLLDGIIDWACLAAAPK
jgi:hypothetical protein